MQIDMVKLFMNLLYLGLAVQLTAYLFWQVNFFGDLVSYPVSVSNLYGSGSMISLNAYSMIIGLAGASVIGVGALLLKTGVYAVFAMLLFGVGVMFTFTQGFFLAIPNTLAAFLPASTNPVPGSLNPILVVISIIFAFAAFMYFFGLCIQRDP